MAGVRLILLHPEVAYRDCGDCQKYHYDPVKGERMLYRGEPREREPGEKPPCRGTGCPKGTPEKQKSLNNKNWRAFKHWLRCKAVGQFPDDAIVRENARIIQSVYDQIERFRSEQTVSVLTGVLTRLNQIGKS